MKLKQRQNIFHVIVHANSITQLDIRIKNRITTLVNVNVKIVEHAKKDYSWNTSKCICENIKYLKNMANTSVIMCGEIISVMDIVATKMTNAIARNGPINSDSKNVRYKINCYIFTKVLLAIILLLIITIICYHYAKNRAKDRPS